MPSASTGTIQRISIYSRQTRCIISGNMRRMQSVCVWRRTILWELDSIAPNMNAKYDSGIMPERVNIICLSIQELTPIHLRVGIFLSSAVIYSLIISRNQLQYVTCYRRKRLCYFSALYDRQLYRWLCCHSRGRYALYSQASWFVQKSNNNYWMTIRPPLRGRSFLCSAVVYSLIIKIKPALLTIYL